ncbi:MAG: flagellar basal body P-ring protein FlgI [Thiohalospira sp.]
MQRRTLARVIATLLVGYLLIGSAEAMRIKDLADIQGVRSNQLVGYGLVVGLNDSGDSSNNGITMQTVANMLEHMGLTLDREAVDV